MSLDLKQLFDTMPQTGSVRWIGLRPARRQEMTIVEQASIDLVDGLVGDRFSGGAGAKRQITLIQIEHLQVVAAIMGWETLDPGLVRRNIGCSGINLLALKNRKFQIGTAILEGTGLCQPCSRMEEQLGAGGYNAMRGHGGITARVVEPGDVAVGSAVKLVQ